MVVIADDTAHVRDRFSAALQGAGHGVIEIKSASELLARLRAERVQIDLVVLDLRLRSPGIELVREIRQIDAEIPILIFSGSIGGADEVRELARV